MITKNFKLFISSFRLLRLTAKLDTMHADATYKCLWNGFPILINGVTDMDKKFHPSGISICKFETVEEFDFIFTATKAGIEDELFIEFKADCLVADSANAILNGFNAVFGDNISRIMCYAHVPRAIEKRLKG